MEETIKEYGEKYKTVITDITERHRMEKALRQSEEKYRTILESIQEGYFEIDLTGKYTFFQRFNVPNPWLLQRELMGMNHGSIQIKKPKKNFFKYLIKFITRENPQRSRLQIIRKTGLKDTLNHLYRTKRFIR